MLLLPMPGPLREPSPSRPPWPRLQALDDVEQLKDLDGLVLALHADVVQLAGNHLVPHLRVGVFADDDRRVVPLVRALQAGPEVHVVSHEV